MAICLIVLVAANGQSYNSVDTAEPYSGTQQLSDSDLEKLKEFPFEANICKGYQIPTGYVIVAETTVISCPGSFPNAWTVKFPGYTEVVCKVSPIPPNYGIQGEGSSVSCPGSFPNTLSIRRLK